jgi:hypothetical protein
MTDASVMVRGVLKTAASNTIVSAPAAANVSKTAWRKLPAPVSFVLVTVNVAAAALIPEQARITRHVAITLLNDLVFVIFGLFRCGYQPKAPMDRRTRQKSFREKKISARTVRSRA